MKKYKISLYIALILTISTGIVLFEYMFYRQIPETLYIQSGEAEEIEFALPVTAELTQPHSDYIEVWENKQNRLDNTAKSLISDYVWELKLFGIIPLKNVDVRVVDEEKVYPIGSPIGIYVKTDGVLVAGIGEVKTMGGSDVCPCDNILQIGDYILEIDGIPVEKKAEVTELIHTCGGKQVVLTLRRNGEISKVKVTPVANEVGEYQIGAWIRDSAQGIGTITYIDEENRFGALGHGIVDIDTGELVDISYGELYETRILNITKGNSGKPGEINGVIHFAEDAREGVVELNTNNGIYGHMDKPIENAGLDAKRLYPVAMKQDIKKGHAQIICTINGVSDYYDIKIKEIDYSQSKSNRGLIIEVTDPALLSQTGGIVQGMSGSPIIQDGKIIGAVTHVLVNDPTRGYGIFIESMLNTEN